MIWVLSVVGIVEFLIGGFMFVVWQDVKYDMEWVKKGREQCFACQTGASVTSFDSRAKFCDHHLAHWVLITSLEAKTRGVAVMDNYDEFVLARVIANNLDGEYDDGREVFTSAKVVNGFQVIVKVTGAMDYSESIYTVTVAEGEMG